MDVVVKSTQAPGIEIQQRPIPEPGAGEVRVRVEAVSICGTDIHLYDWNAWAQARVHTPRVMGHEICGLVDAYGAGVSSPALGTRVAVESHVVCHICAECRRGEFHVCANTSIIGVDRDGGFAQYVVVPAANLWPLNPNVPAIVGAAMEPIGNAVHATSYEPLNGANILIFGAGPIGCAAASIALHEGAKHIISVDPSPFRRQLATDMGATAVVDPAAGDIVDTIRGMLGGQDIDGVLEMSGATQAVHAGIALVRPGGWISMLGIGDAPVTVDFSSDVVMRGITIHGIVGRKLFATWEKTSAYIAQGAIRMDTLVTDTMPLTDIVKAFEHVKSGETGKVVLIPEDVH